MGKMNEMDHTDQMALRLPRPHPPHLVRTSGPWATVSCTQYDLCKPTVAVPMLLRSFGHFPMTFIFFSCCAAGCKASHRPTSASDPCPLIRVIEVILARASFQYSCSLVCFLGLAAQNYLNQTPCLAIVVLGGRFFVVWQLTPCCH